MKSFLVCAILIVGVIAAILWGLDIGVVALVNRAIDLMEIAVRPT